MRADCSHPDQPDWNGDWDDQLWTCPVCGQMFHMVHDDATEDCEFDYHYWMPGPYP